MQYAFIDESGDPSLEFDNEGVSAYFIVAAVLVDSQAIDEARQAAEAIRSDEFQTGEMKSSTIANNHQKRLRVLTRINRLPLKLFALVVDKRELRTTGGFIYRQSFIKYINGRLYRTLFNAYEGIHVIADQHGRLEFMNGFKRYMQSRHMDTLFAKQTFEFIDSRQDVMVQIADIFAGSLARVYEPSRITAESPAFLAEIVKSSLEIDHWPYGIAGDGQVNVRSGESDDEIRQLSQRAALRFIAENVDDGDPVALLQVAFVRYLLYVYRYHGPDVYVSTEEILEYIENAADTNLTTHYFRTYVVAGVRDHGVIVASSKKGYKIPHGLEDLLDYVGHAHSIISPMLRRLREVRKQILLTTSGQCDILERGEFEYLRILVGEGA